MNPMKQIRIAKVTLNIGAGKDQKLLEKGEKLLASLTGKKPVKTITDKRIQSWGLRPGLPIGVKVTLRGKDAEEIIPRLLSAKDKNLPLSSFDNYGNISFGIPEYVDIAGAKYLPEIGIIGLQASITLERPGYRVMRRKIKTSRIPRHHRVTREEAINYMKEKFGLKVGDNE